MAGRAWRVGERVGAYVLAERIGGGGMGAVYRGRHVQTGVDYAIKALLPGAHPDLVLRFLREGQAQARVDAHPNVVRIHAADRHEGTPYLVMDLAAGGDLAARLAGGPLPPRGAAEVVLKLARGLAHVHAQGVLHRDLKPENVLFDERGVPRLVDFGLARLEWDGTLTESGELLGTPSYMAPEQAMGRRDQIDARTDVYGLGALLYHLLAGRPPFAETSALVTLSRVMKGGPVSPDAVRPEVPPELAAICMQALSLAPADRYPDAGTLAGELERFLAGEPLTATRRAGGPAARRRGLALAGLGVVGAAALALGFVRGQGEGGGAPAASAEAQSEDRPTGPLSAPPPPPQEPTDPEPPAAVPDPPPGNPPWGPPGDAELAQALRVAGAQHLFDGVGGDVPQELFELGEALSAEWMPAEQRAAGRVLLRAAAAAAHPMAMGELGDDLTRREETLEPGLELLRRAMEAGEQRATFRLARLLVHGRGGRSGTRAEGFQLLADLLGQGNVDDRTRSDAKLWLGLALCYGWGTAPDTARGTALLEDAAHDHALALTHLGELYLYGRGDLAADPARGLAYLRRAAEEGTGASAQLLLGDYYGGAKEGQPVVDAAAARRWYRAAREKARPLALRHEAELEARLERWAEAEDLYRRAAEAAVDDPDFRLTYGRFLQDRGRHEDAVRAFRQALADGSVAAGHELGVALVEGLGVAAPEPAAGRRLIVEAAEAGCPEAQRWLTEHEAR